MVGKRVKFFSKLLNKKVSGVVLKENAATVVLEVRTTLVKKHTKKAVFTPNLVHKMAKQKKHPFRKEYQKAAKKMTETLVKRYDKHCTYSQKNDKNYITIKKTRLV